MCVHRSLMFKQKHGSCKISKHNNKYWYNKLGTGKWKLKNESYNNVECLFLGFVKRKGLNKTKPPYHSQVFSLLHLLIFGLSLYCCEFLLYIFFQMHRGTGGIKYSRMHIWPTKYYKLDFHALIYVIWWSYMWYELQPYPGGRVSVPHGPWQFKDFADFNG